MAIDSRIKDLGTEQLQPLVETKAGEVYNAEQVERTIQALTDKIGELGYAFAEIEPLAGA